MFALIIHFDIVSDRGDQYELSPDGNSFDFFAGLICRKLWKYSEMISINQRIELLNWLWRSCCWKLHNWCYLSLQ